MEVIYPHCAGLDVHKQTVVACVRIASDGAPLQQVRTFDTTTSGLLALADWLDSLASSMSPWKPPACTGSRCGTCSRPLRADPGQRRACEKRARPQDRCQRRDVAGGLAGPRADPCQLRAARGGEELRTLTRTRKQFVRERAGHVQRIDKGSRTPTSSSVSCSATSWARAGARCCRPSSTVTPIPNGWPRDVTTRVKASRAELLEALRGRISAHHRFMLKLHLSHINALDQAIATIEKEGAWGSNRSDKPPGTCRAPCPGLSATASNVVVAEIGIDMARFATPGHLLSWACMCPRNDASVRKCLKHPACAPAASGSRPPWSRWLGRDQGQGQLPASTVPPPARPPRRQEGHHRRGRLDAHRHPHMLRDGTEWHDLGAAHFDRADAQKIRQPD